MMTTMMTGIRRRSRARNLLKKPVAPAPTSVWTASEFMLSPKSFHRRDDIVLAPAAGERFRDSSPKDDVEPVADREPVQIVGYNENRHLLRGGGDDPEQRLLRGHV